MRISLSFNKNEKRKAGGKASAGAERTGESDEQPNEHPSSAGASASGKPEAERRGGKRSRRAARLPVRPSSILMAVVVLVGVGLLLYPTVSDWWNSMHQTRAITQYTDYVSELDAENCAALLAEAEAYNEWLYETDHGLGLSDDEIGEYEAMLRIEDSDVIGYIEIDKIDCYLPICLGTDEGTLQNAVGHLEGSSLPVGGENTHSVLSGHRGLPSAKLFTDLDLMEVGDTFVIHVLNRTLTYEVDQILTVLPNEVDALDIEEGMDYCTLITCTPYGVNTHRLLVRGHRIENAVSEWSYESLGGSEDPFDYWLRIASIAAAILGIAAAAGIAITLAAQRRK